MNITVIGKKCTPRENFKERAEKKLNKLDKFFGRELDAKVVATVEKSDQTVEITVTGDGIIYRAQERADNLNDALDRCVDTLIRKIRKNKTKLEKRLHDGVSFDELVLSAAEEEAEPEETEADAGIVRTKAINVKPETVDEAILQMDLLGHEFYMFTNADTGIINVVYKRRDGGYGLIEPSVE